MNRRCFWIIGLSLWFLSLMAHAASCMVEAEAFTYKGGWVVDQQFMDQMGSPYLLAHGMGSPVADAYTRYPSQSWAIIMSMYALIIGRLPGRLLLVLASLAYWWMESLWHRP